MLYGRFLLTLISLNFNLAKSQRIKIIRPYHDLPCHPPVPDTSDKIHLCRHELPEFAFCNLYKLLPKNTLVCWSAAFAKASWLQSADIFEHPRFRPPSERHTNSGCKYHCPPYCHCAHTAGFLCFLAKYSVGYNNTSSGSLAGKPPAYGLQD